MKKQVNFQVDETVLTGFKEILKCKAAPGTKAVFRDAMENLMKDSIEKHKMSCEKQHT